MFRIAMGLIAVGIINLIIWVLTRQRRILIKTQQRSITIESGGLRVMTVEQFPTAAEAARQERMSYLLGSQPALSGAGGGGQAAPRPSLAWNLLKRGENNDDGEALGNRTPPAGGVGCSLYPWAYRRGRQQDRSRATGGSRTRAQGRTGEAGRPRKAGAPWRPGRDRAQGRSGGAGSSRATRPHRRTRAQRRPGGNGRFPHTSDTGGTSDTSAAAGRDRETARRSL